MLRGANPHAPLIRWGRGAAAFVERVLAFVLLAGVVAFGLASAIVLAGMDWRGVETFYDLVYRVLMLVIGVELARTLLTHDLEAILELLAFVVARKILKPDVTALDILLCVTAFVGLLAARRYVLGLDAAGPPEPSSR